MWEEARTPTFKCDRIIGQKNCCSQILMNPHYIASTMYLTQTHTNTLTLNHSCAVRALCLPNIFTVNIKIKILTNSHHKTQI